jgi:hypothetical protein
MIFLSTQQGYYEDGPFPGQKFREEILMPALKANAKVLVDIDGTRGFGSSFLEEAFGGLVRVHHFSVKTLMDKLEITGSLETYKMRIWQHIKDAAK